MNRIICAANLFENDVLVLGVRHFDETMHNQIKQIGSLDVNSKLKCTQGFIDKFGKFHDRQSAYVIANEANQIIRRVGGDSNKLFSENLY